ncbi:MAG: MarR family transcriptional regulator [Pseudomonadota bacterium]
MTADITSTETRPLAGPEVRLWLRLLTCTNEIEGELRRRLRQSFDVTLPRFDFLAQLDRAPEGLTMGQLSRNMMVTNGNVTGIAERLAAEGLIERKNSPGDKRTVRVTLTDEGREAFSRIAEVHHGWVEDLFDGLSVEERDQLASLLSRVKASVANHTEDRAE